MQTRPPEPAVKRTRLKSKEAVAKPAATTAVVKKSRPRRVAVEAPLEAAATPATEQEINDMIATAAYYLAAARSFRPGSELDDWLEAERRIRTRQ